MVLVGKCTQVCEENQLFLIPDANQFIPKDATEYCTDVQSIEDLKKSKG